MMCYMYCLVCTRVLSAGSPSLYTRTVTAVLPHLRGLFCIDVESQHVVTGGQILRNLHLIDPQRTSGQSPPSAGDIYLFVWGLAAKSKCARQRWFELGALARARYTQLRRPILRHTPPN
jgi:hypothetical protein